VQKRCAKPGKKGYGKQERTPCTNPETYVSIEKKRTAARKERGVKKEALPLEKERNLAYRPEKRRGNQEIWEKKGAIGKGVFIERTKL